MTGKTVACFLPFPFFRPEAAEPGGFGPTPERPERPERPEELRKIP